MLDYLKEHLPKVTFGEVAFVFGCIAASAKGIEDVFGVKHFGNKIWGWFKAVITYPMRTHQSLIENTATLQQVNEKLVSIENEVKFNGGKLKLRDVIENMDKRGQENHYALKELKMYMQTSDELNPEPIMKFDQTGYLMYCNRALYDYFGYKESDLRGMNYENHIKRRDLQDFQTKMLRAIQTKSDFINTHVMIDPEYVEHSVTLKAVPQLINDELRGFYGILTINNKQQ